MRFNEINAHRDTVTAGELFKALDKSTMSQRDVDEIKDVVGRQTQSHVRFNASGLEQVCTVADVDPYEVFDLVGMEFK